MRQSPRPRNLSSSGWLATLCLLASTTQARADIITVTYAAKALTEAA